MIKTENSQRHSKSGLFSFLLLLTLFFIFLEISVLVQGSEIYLGDYKLVAAHLKIPVNVIPGIFYFLLAQIFLHLIFTSSIWLLTCSISKTLHLTTSTELRLGIFLWFTGIIWILVANQFLFPNSKFAHLTSVFISQRFNYPVFLGCSLFFVIVLLFGIYRFIVKKSFITLSLLLISSFLWGITFFYPKKSIQDASSEERPNIIIIGIDSLRPDFLGFFGYEKQTPHLDKFLNRSTVFVDAMTPLARTFPAWVSILSGEYPQNTGVRFNLPTLQAKNWENTLPSILRSHGYETVFSTDETRFSNIDEQYGFDKTLTPPIGFNDFLLGNLNDFPMANLIVNTPLGRYLFPNSYGNRPVFITYNPNTFLDFIRPSLMKSRSKPLFLSIHFCLPHYPYFWGKEDANDKSLRNYQASIKRVDQQFRDFLAILKKSQLLNHAIVIVLSDHGEAIELPGDRVTEKDLFVSGNGKSASHIPKFFPASFDFESVNQSAGHGTDVLGLSQYHIVLAFRTFGLKDTNQIKNVSSRVSLLDIKPTLLDFLKLSSDKMDGRSLKHTLFGKISGQQAPFHFFYESDFSPQAVRTVHPETRKILFEGIHYFQLDHKTARLSVKKEMEKLIISSKQFADLYGEWVLALYPQNRNLMMPILVNLHNGLWTNDLSTPFAKNSPVSEMLKELHSHFKSDMKHVMTSNEVIVFNSTQTASSIDSST